MLSFDVSAADSQVILKLARRARALEIHHGGSGRDLMSWTMDFTATHANGNPLRLDELLAADDTNFAHDAFGICRHLDRETGQIGGCFLPRYSQRQDA